MQQPRGGRRKSVYRVATGTRDPECGAASGPGGSLVPSLCEARLHFIAEFFLTFQRLQTGSPLSKPGLQMNLTGLTYHFKISAPTY